MSRDIDEVIGEFINKAELISIKVLFKVEKCFLTVLSPFYRADAYSRDVRVTKIKTLRLRNVYFIFSTKYSFIITRLQTTEYSIQNTYFTYHRFMNTFPPSTHFSVTLHRQSLSVTWTFILKHCEDQAVLQLCYNNDTE